MLTLWTGRIWVLRHKEHAVPIPLDWDRDCLNHFELGPVYGIELADDKCPVLLEGNMAVEIAS